MELVYNVEVRNVHNKQYVNSNGSKVEDFKFYNPDAPDDFVKIVWEGMFRSFQAITNCSNINITVSYVSSISETMSVLYSFYGAENRFVKHN